MIHITQNVAGISRSGEIAVCCGVYDFDRFLFIVNLPDSLHFLEFSGELWGCRRRVLNGNRLTTCLSIFLD